MKAVREPEAYTSCKGPLTPLNPVAHFPGEETQDLCEMGLPKVPQPTEGFVGTKIRPSNPKLMSICHVHNL